MKQTKLLLNPLDNTGLNQFGMGMKTASEDGAKFFFLSVAQKSESELLMERLTQDNEDIKSALVELAEIISEV